MKWWIKTFLGNIIFATIVLVVTEFFYKTGDYALITQGIVGIAVGITAADYVIKRWKEKGTK